MDGTWYWWLFVGLWLALTSVLQVVTGLRRAPVDSLRAAFQRIVGPGILMSIVAGAVYSAILTVMLGFIVSIAE